MSRGNQREVDRQRAQKRNADKKKQEKNKDGVSFQAKMDKTKEIMMAKQKAHEEKMKQAQK